MAWDGEERRKLGLGSGLFKAHGEKLGFNGK